jgi:peptidyl-prolyl cis-trans isomerase SurA
MRRMRQLAGWARWSVMACSVVALWSVAALLCLGASAQDASTPSPATQSLPAQSPATQSTVAGVKPSTTQAVGASSAAAAAGAQQAAEAKSGTSVTSETVKAAAAPVLPTVSGEELDRVVAIVNGDLVLDSDVNQEQRFQALLPYGEASGEYSRDKAIERLINRDLILQQIKLQPELEVSPEDAKKDLDNLKKSLPRCKEFHCETEAGWQKFLATQGFSEQDINTLWQRRMDTLAFIEERFKQGIKITPDQIKTYYNESMLPEYEKAHATPAPLSAISGRIQQVLLQRQVSSLLNDWLNSLRSQGSVVVLHPGEGAP